MKKLPIIFSLFLLSLTNCKKDDSSMPLDPIQQTIDQTMKPIKNSDDFVGAAIGVIHNGKRYSQFYGSKVLGEKQVIDENTVFEIGSITKTFNSVLLAKMQADGQMNLHDEIQKFLPESVKLARFQDKPIQLIHLANHTSGLPRLPDNMDLTSTNPYANYSPEKLYAVLNAFTPSIAPGEAMEYSNLGMGLLGHILQLKTGKSFAELMNEEFFAPLGMKNSYVSADLTQQPNVAQGYYKHMQAPYWTFDPTIQAAGAIQSSLADMMNYLENAIYSPNQKLQAAFKLSQQKTFQIDAGTAIGLGWLITNADGQTIIWHNGGTAGFDTFLGFDAQSKKGVVILFNAQTDDTMATQAGFELLQKLKQL